MRRLRKVFSLTLVLLLLAFPKSTSAQEVAVTGNDYPLVLVHGLAGWGPDEGVGLNYWGSLNEDYVGTLNDNGIETYAVSVGPFSSNWDRACELYAYLKGGRVDYGKAHSEEHQHLRYGKTFEVVYPEWGTEDEQGQTKKIHLIGHSMGGQTSRTVTDLLLDGAEEELKAVLGDNYTDADIQQAVENGELSPLFLGDNDWVHSCTSIATPHDGTALAHGARQLIPLARGLLTIMGGVAESDEFRNLYDFDLEQWGLQRGENESYWDYNARVWASDIWEDTQDISFWDLSIPGAKQLNQWVDTHNGVYYFSFATEETYNSPVTTHELPEPGMNPLFLPSSYYIGSFDGTVDGIDIDSSWFKNDGLVSVCSAKGPSLGANTEITYVDMVMDTPQKGRWNFMGTLDSTDHIDIIGFLTPHKKTGWYKALGEYLQSLNP